MSRQYFSITQKVGGIPELDGLRGIAILLVVLRHATYPVYEEYGHLYRIGGWDIATPLLNGWMGVDLFFVLSGFLITHHLLQRWPEEFNRRFLMRYWGKRVLRTFPAYYAAVLIALAGVIPYFTPASTDPVETLRVHLLFLQDYLASDLVPAFWSLGVEEKFYLLSPLFLWWIRRRSPRLQFSLLAAAAFVPLALRVQLVLSYDAGFSSYPEFFWTVRSPFHLSMDGLWIGTIAAMIYRNPVARQAIANVATPLLTTAIIALCLLAGVNSWFEEGHGLASAIVLNLVAVAFGMLLLGAITRTEQPCRPLRSSWLRGLSTVSYSVYLLHMMLVPAAMVIARHIANGADLSPLQLLLLFAPVFAALSLATGYLLHLSVEKPFLLLKDRIKL